MTTNVNPLTVRGAWVCLVRLLGGKKPEAVAPTIAAELADLQQVEGAEVRPFQAFVRQQVKEREQGGKG